jgi:hypothetical protein
MEWLSPPLVSILLLAAVLSIVAGRLRREPIRSIALNAVGYPLGIAGFAWAGSVSASAFAAAAAASLGSMLTMAAFHARREAETT